MGGASEVEFKLVLSDEHQVERLLAELGERPGRAARQVNHFLDADGRLRAERLALRLRDEEGAWTLTAKGEARRSDADGALSERPEEEVRLDAGLARALLAGEADALGVLAAALGRVPLVAALERACDGRPLRSVGCFANARARLGPLFLEGPRGTVRLLLELDRTSFPGGRVEHEVEAEVAPADAPAAEAALRALFERAGLPWRSAPSKAQRFFEALDAAR